MPVLNQEILINPELSHPCNMRLFLAALVQLQSQTDKTLTLS